MRKGYVILLLTPVLGATLLLQSYSSGPASNNTRATGAPGDGPSTCVSCHNSGGAFGPVTINVDMQDENGNGIAGYQPDSVYTVSITVNHSAGTPAGFGFQMICLKNTDNTNLPGWSNPSSNAKLSTSAGRNYVEHKAISASNVFTVEWKAPQAGTGSVTFYVGANAVNANGNSGGDNAALTSLSISEIPVDTTDTLTGITTVARETPQWRIYPNPARDVLHIHSGGNTHQNAHIYDIHGNEIISVRNTGWPVNLQSLPGGYYVIRMAGQPGIQRFLKL